MPLSTIADADVHAGPGDAIIVPANAVLQLRNASADRPATITAVTSAGMRATFPPPWAR